MCDYVASVPIGGGASQSVEWADAITAANSIPQNATFKVTGRPHGRLTRTHPDAAARCHCRWRRQGDLGAGVLAKAVEYKRGSGAVLAWRRAMSDWIDAQTDGAVQGEFAAAVVGGPT